MNRFFHKLTKQWFKKNIFLAKSGARILIDSKFISRPENNENNDPNSNYTFWDNVGCVVEIVDTDGKVGSYEIFCIEFKLLFSTVTNETENAMPSPIKSIQDETKDNIDGNYYENENCNVMVL